MKNLFGFLAFLTLVILIGCNSQPVQEETKSTFEKRMEEKLYPEEGHIIAKNYPEKTFAYKAYEASMSNIKKMVSSSDSRNGSWVNEGPGNIGGRVNTIAMHPSNPDEMMLGYGCGGIFKTDNGGEDWYPVFDNEDIMTISDVHYDPNDGNIIYAGTGDLNISGYAKNGRGVFKSVDSGTSWERIGLEDAGVIAEIGISKSNSDIVYAASMGIPFLRTEDRGLYKSINGGEDWEQVLYLNDSTGVIDIEVHPDDPNIVYAASWTRIRNNEESIMGGDQVGIFKTTDGGITWERLSNGLPEGELVRPGLEMFEGDPDVIYSIFVHDNQSSTCSSGYQLEGVYKTSDAGASWVEVSTREESGLPCTVLGGFGWYFGQIRVNPLDEDMIFILGVDGWVTKNGGSTWERATPGWATYEVHADLHDMAFNGTELYLATDGGAYKTDVAAEQWEWQDIENIVATQFYRVALSPFNESFVYGGAQDNGTTGGNESRINIWSRIYGGDGFQMVFHPTDPLINYVETQNGRIRVTKDGSLSYQNANNGLYGSKNWDMQYIMSSSDPSMLYAGTNRMFRSVGTAIPYWEVISEDLTDELDTYGYTHNISTLDESIVNTDILYCGTSDGFVWRSLDFGVSWDQINEGLPRRYISDIKASKHEENTVYLTIQGYKDNDNTPYIYKSIDNGDNWVHINGDLPQIAINDILLPPDVGEEETIFIGTDGGVFFTRNGGVNWERMGDNMPIVPIYDLEITPDNKLVAGSFARGIYTFDLSQLEQTGVTEVEQFDNLKIYPTIANESLMVEVERDVLEIDVSIIAVDGIEVYNRKHQNGVALDISFLHRGSYYLVAGKTAKMFIKI